MGLITLNLSQAKEKVKEHIKPLPVEKAAVINTFGRVIAEDIYASSECVPSPVSRVDGYAAIAADTDGANEKNPIKLSIHSENIENVNKICNGTVVVIKIGDPLPKNANCVIDKSKTYRPEMGAQLLVLDEYHHGQNVKYYADIKEGDTVLKKGTKINACEMALLASLGKTAVSIFRKPKVSVITTGKNVIDLVEEYEPGTSRNSARYWLVGVILDSGCELGKMVHVRDGRPGLEKALKKCADSDLILTALAEIDKHDFAIAAINNVGKSVFDRIHIDKGASTCFGYVDNKPVFITGSENIIPSYEAVVRLALMLITGNRELERPLVRSKLKSTIKLNPGNYHLIPAITTFDMESGYSSRPLNPRQSLIPNSMITISENVE
ncbi:MAG: molybdopterin-binding protein, partial [Armatimonadota bacterium]